jgi:hypothetical protein
MKIYRDGFKNYNESQLGCLIQLIKKVKKNGTNKNRRLQSWR